MLNKVKQSKVNESKDKAEKTDFGPLFEDFWKGYPKEGRFHKKDCLQKFLNLCNKGELENLKTGFAGYLDFLKHKELNENFKQQPMHVSTFLNKERYKTYINFKYEPRL